MAITDVIEAPPLPVIGTGRSLSTARVFSILVDDSSNDGVWLRQQEHADIPGDGASYGGIEPWLRAVDRRIAGEYPVYTMTVNYRVPNTSGLKQGAGASANPLEDPPDISWTTEPRTVVIDVDINGLPIRNSAKEEFTPLPTREVADSTLTIGINQASWGNMALESWKNHVNNATWMGYPKETGRLRVANASMVYFGTRDAPQAHYWRATYQITFRYLVDPVDQSVSHWRYKVLDQGYRELNEAGDDYQPIKISGEKPAKAWPLNGFGRKLSKAQMDDRSNYKWLKWDIYKDADFAALFEPLGIISAA